MQYAKRGRLRFSSTRDFQRALERALRRADIPTAFSAGFHPHPKISYANAAPTGTASEAEYFEVQLRERREPAEVLTALDAALPDGLDILAVAEAEQGALADRLQGSRWRLDFPAEAGSRVADAAARLLDLDTAEVSRMTKRGERSFDVRAAIVALTADGGSLELVLRHQTPLVRPDDVLAALHRHAGLDEATRPLVTRLSQGPLTDAQGTIGNPLETG
ncbi:TIGR03936 family radical SAM-associated protein [Flexivirga meconopsidis]|uniref:TIGR03936 family radical SAM-associated protein n=1 Tax=Flexivirga meconopsidis TaxID=2977121 RepID=UPI003CC6321D